LLDGKPPPIREVTLLKTKLQVLAATMTVAIALLAIGALRPIAGTGAGPRDGARPADAGELAQEALDLLRESRAAADPTLLPKARQLARRSLELQPTKNFEASVAMAALSNASHDFSRSVRWSRRAIRINPFGAAPYGLLGDALFELGQYHAADAAYQNMIDRRPDVASYVRASYAAQSHGEWDDAIAAMRAAIDAAPPTGEEPAWLRHQLGDIYASTGNFARSERENRIGTKLAPGYVPPTVGVAESLIARKGYEEALPIMERAVSGLPAVEYFVTLGDLYWVLGDRASAQDTYDRAADRLALYRSSGVRPDHDFVLFYADHGLRTGAAVREARAIYADRPTAAAADSLAWTLHAAGRDRLAYRYAREALRRERQPDGTQHFHAAAIAHALGRTEQAARLATRALEINSTFSLFHLEQAQALAGVAR